MSGMKTASGEDGKRIEAVVTELPAGAETRVQASVSVSGGELGSKLAEPFRMAMRCKGMVPPAPALAVGEDCCAGPLIVTVEVAVIAEFERDVTCTVTVLVPLPVTVAFSGNSAALSAVTKKTGIDWPDCPFTFTSDAVTGPVVPVIFAV